MSSEVGAPGRLGPYFVVAQGIEAGGHVRGHLSLDALLPEVLEAVEVPVVAAGGIATAERVKEVMDNGADGVRIGTRFVATTESDAHPEYVRRLLAAVGPRDTELTTHFDKGWPNAQHRVLRSALVEARNKDFHEVSPPSSAEDGPVGFRALYAGCGVGEIHSIVSATQVVDELMTLLH